MNTGYRRYNGELYEIRGGNSKGEVHLYSKPTGKFDVPLKDTQPVTDTELVEENARLTAENKELKEQWDEHQYLCHD